jgi:hypothetical protein
MTRFIPLKTCALFLALSLLVPGTFGMDWPAREGVLLGNFGWINGNQPVLGASFAARGPIHAADAGELIFSHSISGAASRLPSPLGAWVALDHGDWLIGIYSRFEDKKESIYPTIVEKDGVIAQSGQSGWTGRDGFYLSFYDRKERRWVNPATFITPMADSRAPAILAVQIRNADGRAINPSQVRSLSQGRYTVFAQVADTMTGAGENPLAPHRIGCSVNGIEIGGLNFETFTARDGSLMASRNSLVPVEQVYGQAPFFEIGEAWFNRGQATLEIIAQDIAGNERNLTYRLQIE